MMILVTGANGFVGTALCKQLTKIQIPVRAIVRSPGQSPADTEVESVGDISSKTDWSHALRDVTEVVHLASRVHIMNDKSADPLAEYRLVNVQATINLASQAAAAGVRRFIFLSSIKVNGEFTQVSRPFTADDVPAPEDAYGVSKLEAEVALKQIAIETGMEVVIIRPPLVYGPGVKSNFQAMMRWLVKGIPLPLAALTNNRRSLVALDNLIDLISTCLNHPAAANQTFLVSDAEDLSTADLLKRSGAALGRPARLFYLPTSLLKLVATMLNKSNVYQRLSASLQIDISKTRERLAWTPPISVDEGLRRAAKAFLR
jgi:nucleoside-diphosphate-sugar epimerase